MQRMKDIEPSRTDETLDIASGPRQAPNSPFPRQDSSRLLAIPPELRAEIFAYVLADVRCRRPVIVWDDVCISISGREHLVSTALLQTCRTTYQDSASILYDRTTVQISIRGDSQNDGFPRFQVCLGAIDDCPLLSRFRHVELEVAYTCHEKAVARVSERIRKFAAASSKLKTIDLTFFDQSLYSTGPQLSPRPNRDSILEACEGLCCDKFVEIKRNLTAERNMGATKWLALRRRVNAHFDDHGKERFRELSFDGCFEHAFRQKN